MCGRLVTGDYTYAQMYEILRRFLNGAKISDSEASAARGGWNIKPTQQLNMLAHEGGAYVATSARWWFVPHWFKGDVKGWKQTTFNARIETAAEKPTFRTAWESARCVIPAIGYYEWTGPKKDRRPNYITVKTNAPLIFFAGLHSKLRDGTRTCTILTREAAPQIAHIHHRMPVILTADEIDSWTTGQLTTAAAQNALGMGWGGRFRFYEVRKLGRDAEGPELIEPI